MNRWWRALLKGMMRRRQKLHAKQPRRVLALERLEDRTMPSASPAQHVLLLSVDGLHQADVADPALQQFMKNIVQLEKGGVTYTDAHTTSPSDSFPGTLSYLTGAGPGTTGVFYDDSYSRALFPPGTTLAQIQAGTVQPGTEVTYFEAIDKNQALISGGGNFDASSIDPSKLPVDQNGNPVYPNQFLPVNTIFDVAHDAGLYTAFSDKHPAYQIANGPDSTANINDFYGPEINSTTALLDTTTGKTVNADALLNGSAKPVAGATVAPGYTVKTFATDPNAATNQPDSIAVDGLNVYVGYGNNTAKDGTDGKSSTIVQYTTDGKVVKTFTVAGHNDGLKVDPSTHKLWALQNEDGNANLVVIDPATGTTTKYNLASVNGGGGFDDIAFAGGKAYLTASAPANDPNTSPAVVQITLGVTGGIPTATLTPVLFGNANAINAATWKVEALNLQDPDSMTTGPDGSLVLTSQADNELVTIHNPGTANQTVTVLHLKDASGKPVSVDDTLFAPGAKGEVLVTELNNGAIYQVTVPPANSDVVLSAARDIGQVGYLNLKTGLFTPVISIAGSSPRGLAFVNAGPFADLSQYTLVDPSTDPMGANDPNLINDTTKNVLLTEKYDDLKVQAILNEIDGLPSHASPDIIASQIPALFGMNFQAVSVAEKDANGGIALLPNGAEGAPSTLLEGAIQHTDASIGKIVAELKAKEIWDTTEVVLTAKHGQAPRVGSAGLMADSTIPNLLNNAGDTVAQATQDDVSLIWLKDQTKTADAVKQLENFKNTGTIDVFFQGVKQTLPASQVIDKILSGQGLVNAGLGNPATNSTTPDILVILKPGYIWVGNTSNPHKNAEHGGFSQDDTHVALVVGGGAVNQDLQGTTVTDSVKTTQIAVTALEALGLDPNQLQGAVKEDTKALPGLGLPVGKDVQAVEGQKIHDQLVATFTVPDGQNPNDAKIDINWGDGTNTSSKGLEIVHLSGDLYGVKASHTFQDSGTFQGSVAILLDGVKTQTGFRATVADAKVEGDHDKKHDEADEKGDDAAETAKDDKHDGEAKDVTTEHNLDDGQDSDGQSESGEDGDFQVLGSHKGGKKGGA